MVPLTITIIYGELIMLKGVKAFEACWTALKQTYPTSKAENTLLVQSMGRFVDHYATQAEIRETLPDALKKLFDRLVDAYLNGYDPGAIQATPVLVGAAPSGLSPAMTLSHPSPGIAPVTARTEPPRITTVTEPSPAMTLSHPSPGIAPVTARTEYPRITAATLAASERRQQTPIFASRSEADTLIVDADDRETPQKG
jgi:hypothetical protein